MASMLRTLVVAVLALALGADATFFYPVYQPFIPGLYGAGYGGFGGGSTVVVVSGHRKLLAANATSSSTCDTAAAVLDRTPELRCVSHHSPIRASHATCLLTFPSSLARTAS